MHTADAGGEPPTERAVLAHLLRPARRCRADADADGAGCGADGHGAGGGAARRVAVSGAQRAARCRAAEAAGSSGRGGAIPRATPPGRGRWDLRGGTRKGRREGRERRGGLQFLALAGALAPILVAPVLRVLPARRFGFLGLRAAWGSRGARAVGERHVARYALGCPRAGGASPAATRRACRAGGADAAAPPGSLLA